MHWKRALEITAMVMVGLGSLFALAVALAPYLALLIAFRSAEPGLPAPSPSR